MDDLELWHCDSSYGCGMLKSIGGMIVGGAPIFYKLNGQLIRLLPKHYKLTHIGIEKFQSRATACSWDTHFEASPSTHQKDSA